MKQNVQCPTCEAKLSVFVLGKPITQKCPKCGNTFDVSPDGTVATPAAETPSTSTSAPATDASEKPAAAPAAFKPSASSPVTAIAPEPVVAESGITFLHVLVIFGLLLLIIVVQVVTFKKTESHLNVLSQQVEMLTKKVAQP